MFGNFFSQKNREVFGVLSLLLGCALVYLPILFNGPFHIDDMEIVFLNVDVIDFNVFELLSKPRAQNYFPLTNLVHGFQYQLFQGEAWGFHFVSLLIHLVNVFLCYIFLSKFFNLDSIFKVLILGLFAFHTMHLEAVAWISAQGDLWAFLFLFSSLLLYEKFKRFDITKFYVFSLLAYLISFGFQGRGLSFFPVFLLVDYFFIGKVTRKDLLRVIPYALISGSFFAIYFFTRRVDLRVSEKTFSILDSLLKAPVLLLSYLKMSLLPIFPSVNYRWGSLFAHPWEWIILATFLLFVIWSYWQKTSQWKNSLFGILFFCIILLPVLKILPYDKQGIVAERYLYVPLVGALVFFFSPLKPYKWIRPVLAIALLLLGFHTFKHAQNWESTEKVYAASIRGYPQNIKLRLSYADRLIHLKEYEEAEKQLEKALSLNPQSGEAYQKLAKLALHRNQIAMLGQYAKKAIEHSPHHFQGHYYYAYYLRKNHQYEKALSSFQKAIHRAPKYFTPYREMGHTYLKMGKLEKAKLWLNKALKRNPSDYMTYNIFAALNFKREEYQKALKNLKRALEINPEFETAARNLTKIRAFLRQRIQQDE